MKRVSNLHKTVMDHSNRYQVDDTMGVATILRVPKLYWHEKDGPVPSDQYVNFRYLVDLINQSIEVVNLEFGPNHFPKLHNTATRKSKGPNGAAKYMWGAFRETKKEDMLHLADSNRFRLAKCYASFFKHSIIEAKIVK